MFKPLIQYDKTNFKNKEFSSIMSDSSFEFPKIEDYGLDNKNSNIIIDNMLKIFNPPEPNNIEEEISIDEINTYFISSKKKINNNESDSTNKSLENQKQKQNANNIFISGGLNPIAEEPIDEKLGKSFISKKRKNNENDNSDNSKNTTQKNTDIHILEKTKTFKYQYRLDYYKKAFKVHCFKNLTKFLNNLLSKCNLPISAFKNKKIFKPNNESFTSNAKEEDNYLFLSMSLKDIFSYIKNDKQSKGISLQKNNKILIEKILNYIELKGNNYSKDFENLKYYLNMKMEDYIKIYYDTEEFQNFCKIDKIQFYENEFIKEKGFHMLEKYGFLRLIKLHQINVNKNFSYGLKSIHFKINGINSV